MLEQSVREFGKRFSKRLDNRLLGYDLGCIDHGETILAFETICDHLLDFDVKITEEEYREAIRVAVLLGLDACIGRYIHLRELCGNEDD
jgi:hypothetical protein